MLKTLSLAWCAILVAALASEVSAQYTYDPYAPAPKDEPPVKADGTLNWPTFYRSEKMQKAYENLWMMGSCGGTNKNITIPVMKNRVDINTMPKGTIEGQVIRVGKGQLWVRDAGGKVTTVATHPAGVSRVEVSGDVSARMLKPGMIVRLMGTVDQVGRATDTIKELDVVSVPAGFEPDGVEPEHRQLIVAEVFSLRGDRLQLKTPSGNLHRLSFMISDETIAHIQAKELGYTTVGDQVSAKGRIYNGDNSSHWVFASDVTVTKPELNTKQLQSVDELFKLSAN
ncbi:hypothetical protein GC197_10375 [bacterium]|nr:hypothetical protein [bacterium]